MKYIKTQGIGFGFTEDKSEAIQFQTPSQAERLRERLRKQFSDYRCEILPDQSHFYLTAHKVD